MQDRRAREEALRVELLPASALKMSRLPIEEVLPHLLGSLARTERALLIAPPGAGKTTMVAPALLGTPWCTGTVLLLVPRRLAARSAAEFMARSRGEKAGQSIGYSTRLDTRVGKSTRVVAMTHGVFLNRIEADPELTGVSAVLFDEVHERSLENDLALALALDAANALRPDLRLVAMSATPDADRFQSLLGDAPTIVSEGKSFPLEIRYLGRDSRARLEPQMAASIRQAIQQYEGSLLAFLPGVAEIERTAQALGELPGDLEVHRLHGSIEPSLQREALAAPSPGKRKIVLATSIAETSLTLEDVRIVVDSGLARRPRYDRGAGLTRLVTERASRAAIIQRAGRAARQAPGVAIRLWEEAATASLPLHDPPEILEADLSSLVLTSLLWGEPDPRRLPFLDSPPDAALEEARRRLRSLGAIDGDERLTDHGRTIAELPMEPRLAHMLIEAAKSGFGASAADLSILLTERGLGGNELDVTVRWRRWRTERSPRAEAARRLAANLCRMIGVDDEQAREDDLGKALALAFPDRVSRRRDPTGETWQSAGGRGFRLDAASPLARSNWLAVGEVAGHSSGARILAAAQIEERELLDLFADRVEIVTDVSFNEATGQVTAARSRFLGAISLSSGPAPELDPSRIGEVLLAAIRKHGLRLIPWSERARGLRSRAAFASRVKPEIPSLDDSMLLGRIDEWLPPLLEGKRGFGDMPAARLDEALQQLLGYENLRRLERFAPSEFVSPAGSRHPIDYLADGGPTVAVRPQALFGLGQHPMIGDGNVPLVLAITSPAGRPIQTTKDLPGFWAGSWREVVKEMRGRYPKHPWPDDPASSAPTLRTKRAR